MDFLDKLYLNIYWCGNNGKGGGFVEDTFGRMFYIPLSGIFMLTLTKLCSIMEVELPIFGLVSISIISTYVLTERFINKYYNDAKRKAIINKYNKPGKSRYLVFISILFGGLALGVICFQTSSTIYHEFVK